MSNCDYKKEVKAIKDVFGVSFSPAEEEKLLKVLKEKNSGTPVYSDFFGDNRNYYQKGRRII